MKSALHSTIGPAILVGALMVSACTSKLAAAPAEPVLAIVGGTVIDGTGGPPRPGTTVLIQGDRILSVGATSVPRGAQVIDATGRTVMPGLIESNGHVTFSGQIDHAAYFANRLDELHEVGVRNLGIALDQGITTIRDTYGPLDVVLGLRDASRDHRVRGSRLFVAGPIINYVSVLDLPTETSLDPVGEAKARAQLDLFVSNGSEAAAAVRRLAAAGVDFIKISADTGPPWVPPELGEEDLRQAVREAHSLGLQTTSHTLRPSTLRHALDAGFDALEHPELLRRDAEDDPLSDDLTPAVASEISRRGIYSIPLIVAAEVYLDYWGDPALLEGSERVRGVPQAMLDEARTSAQKQGADSQAMADMRQFYDQARANLATLIAARAPIAMGTDKGTRYNFFESANHVRELQIYVELGMTPMEALVSATRRGAELLGMADRLGTLAPGKLADVIVVDGDPLADLRALHRVSTVVLNGKQVR